MIRIGVVLLTASVGVAAASQLPAQDPFAFFGPTVRVSAADRAKLDRRETLVRTVGAGEGEVAIFSAARVDISGDRLVEWVRRIERLKESSFVLGIRRFSDPPRLDDLAGLSLDREDLDELRRCRLRDCGVKLNAEEIAQIAATPGQPAATDGPLQETFRRVLLNRVMKYLTDGLAGLPPYEDADAPPVSQAPVFSAILDRSPFLAKRMPLLTDYLQRVPGEPPAGAESFIYWSKEALGGRPIVSMTHVTIVRGDGVETPDALVAAKQIYGSHYMTGSLALTALVGREGEPRYLAYLNRSRLDLFRGVFGGVVRRIVRGRLRSEAGEVVHGLRQRLESGPPGSVKSEF
jgi:hypothetical protein